MPPQVVFPKPLTRAGAILTAPMEIHKESGRIVLSQKKRIWFRAAVCFWALAVLSILFMLYDELFQTHTWHFTCDRGTGVCAIDGQTRDIPKLADIKRAEMDRGWNRRDGRNWGINLVTADGKKHSIEEQRAIKDSVIADYRATVKAINAFLANPGQQKLDTAFTYVASLSEKLVSAYYLLFGLVALYGGLRAWTKTVYSFEAGKITAVVRGPILRTRQEIDAGWIAAIIDRQVANSRFIELSLTDGSLIAIVTMGSMETAMSASISMEIAGLLGKPVQNTVPQTGLQVVAESPNDPLRPS
jgi:hypothetical protein